jgi:predicted nucleic acid-binding protein
MYVTDTNAFVWFLTKDNKLGRKAMEVFLQADEAETQIVVPSIVLLETLHICEKHRMEIKFADVLERIRGVLNYPVYPLDLKVIEECRKLKQLDLHDRVIVATAKLLNAKVLTKDEDILKSKLVEVIWA